jgi:acetoacetyl-CoA synthetase
VTNSQPLWQPSPAFVENANLTAFIRKVGASQPSVVDYDSLYDWSVNHSDQFWSTFWDFSEIRSSQQWHSVLTDSAAMPGAKWFEGVRLNFAENLLRYRDDRIALVSVAEGRAVCEISYAQLYNEVAKCSALLRQIGVS